VLVVPQLSLWREWFDDLSNLHQQITAIRILNADIGGGFVVSAARQ
jgi:hypothetical protein